jgi:prepilin-type N-terminal cleavage/methylation domain-containing protein
MVSNHRHCPYQGLDFQRRKKMNKERGFTLIELLVVIAILAVLFGLTALYLNNVGNNAKATTAQAEADMAQTAIDVYMATGSLSSMSASTNCEKVGPGTSGFGTYLRRTSRFYFAWDSSGNVTTASEEADCTPALWTR